MNLSFDEITIYLEFREVRSLLIVGASHRHSAAINFEGKEPIRLAAISSFTPSKGDGPPTAHRTPESTRLRRQRRPFMEDDFELGGEFLDVFTRASERIAGFVVGCTVIGVVWLAFTVL